jgi:uroporphyrinogen decarboxylase
LNKSPEGEQVPVILFTKGGGQWLESIAATGCHCAGLDWTFSLAQGRRAVKDTIALQGNMDPAILRASPAVIEAEVVRVLSDFGSGSGHVFNLGHGITPDIDPENVSAFVDAVHTMSVIYH